MISTLKLSKKLTTKNNVEKEIYLPKNWSYKWNVEEINKTKKELKQLGVKNE